MIFFKSDLFFLCKISPPPAVKLRAVEITNSENTHSEWKDELFTDQSAFLSGTLQPLRLTSSSNTIWLSHINTMASPTVYHTSLTNTQKHTGRGVHICLIPLQLCPWKKNKDAHSTQKCHPHTPTVYKSTHVRTCTQACKHIHSPPQCSRERGKQ